MADGPFDIWNIIRMKSDFQDVTGQKTDPATEVYCLLLLPDTTQEAYTYSSGQVIRLETGVYALDKFLNQEGKWKYRFVSENTASSPTAEFTVNGSGGITYPA